MELKWKYNGAVWTLVDSMETAARTLPTFQGGKTTVWNTPWHHPITRSSSVDHPILAHRVEVEWKYMETTGSSSCFHIYTGLPSATRAFSILSDLGRAFLSE